MLIVSLTYMRYNGVNILPHFLQTLNALIF